MAPKSWVWAYFKLQNYGAQCKICRKIYTSYRNVHPMKIHIGEMHAIFNEDEERQWIEQEKDLSIWKHFEKNRSYSAVCNICRMKGISTILRHAYNPQVLEKHLRRKHREVTEEQQEPVSEENATTSSYQADTHSDVAENLGEQQGISSMQTRTTRARTATMDSITSMTRTLRIRKHPVSYSEISETADIDVPQTTRNLGTETSFGTKVITRTARMIPISPPKLLVSKSSSAVSPATASNKDDTLDRIILSMASMDLPTAIQSMKAIEKILQKKLPPVFSLQSKEDKFIRSIHMQLKQLQTYSLRVENADVSSCFKNTFLVTREFYRTGFLGKNVSFMHLKKLMDQIISLQVENKLEHFHKAYFYDNMMNNIMRDINEKSNHTTIICVLIQLLHSCAESNFHTKYENFVVDCLNKKALTMSIWAADLDYNTILLKVHCFLKDYPTTWWRKLESDFPLQVVKKVLRYMARVKGSSLLNHLTLINNTNESELHDYLITFIAGLVQLYDFKLQHPEADVQPFLLRSHQFFQ